MNKEKAKTIREAQLTEIDTRHAALLAKVREDYQRYQTRQMLKYPTTSAFELLKNFTLINIAASALSSEMLAEHMAGEIAQLQKKIAGFEKVFESFNGEKDVAHPINS